MPLPTGVAPTVLTEPRNNTDTPLERQSKFSWKADWYVEVDLGAITVNGSPLMTFGQMITTLQTYIDANPGPVGDKLEDALAKVNVALAKILIPDDPAALSELDGAKVEVQAAGLPGPDEADLISGLNQMSASINSGGNAGGKGGNGGNGSLCVSGITHTRVAGLNSPNANQCDDIFFFNADKWYEGREQRYVDVVDIDVNALYNWIGGSAARGTGVMYITIDDQGALDPKGDGTYPVIRLINADKLDAPITFATNHPLYLQGHYNNDPLWYASALVGDAITFLSTVWDDADHQAANQIRPIAADTEIYAAILAGHSGTPCDHEAGGCGATSPYGGGLENFPRFLEDWNPEILMFRGSLVSLTFAQQSTGLWGNGPYYRPPVRDWEFDMRFDDPDNMPPGTPVVGNVIHTAFRPIF